MQLNAIAPALMPGQTEEPSATLPILPYLPELIFGLVAFGIIYWVVKAKVVPNLEKAYAERTEAIQGGIHKAEEAQAQLLGEPDAETDAPAAPTSTPS